MEFLIAKGRDTRDGRLTFSVIWMTHARRVGLRQADGHRNVNRASIKMWDLAA